MKVAISTDCDHVSEHFGRCPSFTIASIEDGKLLDQKVIENPGHQPGYLPVFLSQKEVDCIIAGGMGARARELFHQYNIETILGVSGTVSDVLASLLAGTLAGSENLCTPRKGKGYGVDKSVCDHGGAGSHHHDHEN
jgi:predicted Fe-Mo cluster-binding NifX family protein